MSEIGSVGWRPTAVHPLAARFPMLPPDDFAALALHIKENGLQSPIVIDDNGMLIDGRMRLQACLTVGVEPHYQRLNGHDAEAYIWGANGKRRHLSKGQMAMIAAVGFAAKQRGAKAQRAAEIARLKGEGRGNREVARETGVPETTVRRLGAPKEHSGELAQPALPSGPPAWVQTLDDLNSPAALRWSAALRALRDVTAQRRTNEPRSVAGGP